MKARTIRSRPYQGIHDFLFMTSVLALGRKTSPRAYYVHIGDLSWWMFYSEADLSHLKDRIRLWEYDGRLCGWSLIDPRWESFDLYLLPGICGSEQAQEILDSTIAQAEEMMKENCGNQVKTYWVSEYDQGLIRSLQERGFNKEETFMWYLEYPMNQPIQSLNLPEGFAIHTVRDEVDAFERAEASHSAFESSKLTQDYWLRYQQFMRSPVYNPDFDLVSQAPNGQVASFCIIWPDPVNHIGLFEPVGTHQEFQGQGFGKAIVLAGLQQLQSWGMKSAMVCVGNDNHPAEEMYLRLGFEPKLKLYTFTKQIQT